MKLQSASELPFGNKSSQSRRKSPTKVFPLTLILLTFLLTIITIYYPSLTYNNINPPKLPSLITSSIRPSPSSSVEDDHVSHPYHHSSSDDDDDHHDQFLPPPKPKLSEKEAAPKKDDDVELLLTELPKPETAVVVKKPPERRERKNRRGRRRRESKPSVEETTARRLPIHGDGKAVESSELIDKEECDLFSGEWVPNNEAPYYTNETCFAIQEHQNCMKFGRPDTGFLKWKWKPDGCELPVFDPEKFFELVRGKSLAFVGDSVARNHMQSLICLLSTVSPPPPPFLHYYYYLRFL